MLGNRQMSVYATGEGEEGKRKVEAWASNCVSEREKKTDVEGNGGIPQGGMSLKSPTLLCFKASDASTKLSNEQLQ